MCLSLSLLHPPRQITTLMASLSDADSSIRAEALRSMGRLGLRGILQSMAGSKVLRAVEAAVSPRSATSPTSPTRSGGAAVTASPLSSAAVGGGGSADAGTPTRLSPTSQRALGANGSRTPPPIPRPLVFDTPSGTPASATPGTVSVDVSSGVSRVGVCARAHLYGRVCMWLVCRGP